MAFGTIQLINIQKKSCQQFILSYQVMLGVDHTVSCLKLIKNLITCIHDQGISFLQERSIPKEIRFLESATLITETRICVHDMCAIVAERWQ